MENENMFKVLLSLNEEIINLKGELAEAKKSAENIYKWWQQEVELRKAVEEKLDNANARIAKLEKFLDPGKEDANDTV